MGNKQVIVAVTLKDLDQDHIVLSQSPEKAGCSRIELKRPICQGSETETWGCARGAGGWKMEKGGERPV